MSLEFGIEFSCAVRRRLSEQQLRELARIAGAKGGKLSRRTKKIEVTEEKNAA